MIDVFHAGRRENKGSAIESKKQRENNYYPANRELDADKIKEIRGRGLWVGIEFKKEAGMARIYCEKLMEEGMLCKDTHEQTMRLAPPLCITKDEIDWALTRLRKVLA